MEEEQVLFLEIGFYEALLKRAEESGRAVLWYAAAAEVSRERGDLPALGRQLVGAGRFREALVPLRAAAADAVNGARVVECREFLELWDRAADAMGMDVRDPRRASPLLVRSYLHFHTGQDQLEPVDQALELMDGTDPEMEAKAWYARGGVLRNFGRFSEAIEAYRKAIALEAPNESQVTGLSYQGLASCAYDQKEDGSEFAQQARRIFAERWPFLAYRCDGTSGRGLLGQRRFSEARPFLERAVEGGKLYGWPMVIAEAEHDLAEIDREEGQP